MAMPLDYARPRRYGRPFGEVSPIIEATNAWDAISQIAGFAARHQGFRIGVPDTSFFPFSAICRLKMTFASGTYSGTGFYIGPRLILTCGHNLFDKTADGSGTEAATALTVRVGQQNATTWLDSFEVTPADWTVHPTWVASGASNRGFDLSVIRVSHFPPGGEHFELINYSPAPETPIAVCGYGGEDVDSDRQHLDIDRVRSLSDDYENFEYNLQTRKGNSGSPVFAHFTNTSSELPQAIPVMGVHVAGHSGTLNRGVLLSPDKIEWALGGGISSVSVFSLGRSSLGGLPLQRSAPGMLGGLPLMPPARKTMLRTQSYARPFERAWIVIDQSAAGGMSTAKRTFGHPTHDLSGKTALSVRVPNTPAGGKVLWNIPDATHKTRAALESGGAPTDFVSGTTATLRSTAGGPVALDVMVKDASGTTVESNKYWLSSPQFVIVSIHATTDAFFDGIGLGPRRPAIYAEMAATMRHLYRNVNVRFVFPGDVLPAHLGVGANAAFPGGVQAVPSVIYAEAIGADTVMDPEDTNANGVDTPYPGHRHGRLHTPGTMAAPMDGHALAHGLIHHFAPNRPEVRAVQDAAASGTLPAADMDRAATFYGRLIGENMAHEVGHFATFVGTGHGAGGLTEPGSARTTTERTGFTIDTTGGGALLTDNGRATVNDLDADSLRTFEDFLPIDPPIDQSRFVERGGRVGSFSRAQGWVVGAPRTRQLSGETTVHLPGATILEGWEADAFVFAVETAIRTVLGSNPAFMLLAPFVDLDLILDACDRYGVTLAYGPSVTGRACPGAGSAAAPPSSSPPDTASASPEPGRASSAASTVPAFRGRSR